jgi:hypothetical protein
MRMVYGFVFENEKIVNNMGPIMVLWGVRDWEDFSPFRVDSWTKGTP